MEPDEIVASFTSFKIPKTHATVGLSNLISSNKQYKYLFVNRRLPDAGWSDFQIQNLLFTLSTLDTNNKCPTSQSVSQDGGGRWCGVGEREARVYSSLVLQRNFGLSHGMGRSGDVMEPQPKAVGSSVMVKLTLLLVLDAIRRGSGLNGKKGGPSAHGILLPLCTGMSTALVLSSLRQQLPEKEQEERNIVLWSRIDQKSCFKAIQSAGLRCMVVPTKQQGDEVVTDIDAMEVAIKANKGCVIAIITTASCFAPRVPDRLDEVAKLCQAENVAHVINNAYGLQCQVTCKLINRACVVGRVDAIVCSTDKNFLVPVGGAIVMSPKETMIQTVSTTYAGRASSAPIVDLFITLLSMGLSGYKRLLAERQQRLADFEIKLSSVAEKHGERRLHCPSNTVSFGITLDNLARCRMEEEEEEIYIDSVAPDISYFGAMLFNRCVSGTRVVPRGQIKSIGGHTFAGFGSSTHGYPHAYMTAACAVGLGKGELEDFFERLDKALKEFKKKQVKKGK